MLFVDSSKSEDHEVGVNMAEHRAGLSFGGDVGSWRADGLLCLEERRFYRGVPII